MAACPSMKAWHTPDTQTMEVREGLGGNVCGDTPFLSIFKVLFWFPPSVRTSLVRVLSGFLFPCFVPCSLPFEVIVLLSFLASLVYRNLAIILFAHSHRRQAIWGAGEQAVLNGGVSPACRFCKTLLSSIPV